VTNFHVIQGAKNAEIVFSDHTSCEASLVGAVPEYDIAVLKVGGRESNSQQLRPLSRGTSRNLQVGQRVFAIGNPFGLDFTLTSGIVSGLGREMQGVAGNTIRGLIQTDAAINPGNSGGPLLNARGNLIGVNTMIASPSGAFAGVGFAIPVDSVSRVVEQLVKYGFFKQPYLGTSLLSESYQSQFSRQTQEQLDGVLVLSVEPGSPA